MCTKRYPPGRNPSLLDANIIADPGQFLQFCLLAWSDIIWVMQPCVPRWLLHGKEPRSPGWKGLKENILELIC